MGGTVAVTLRTEDGTEHRMARWTNIFPYMVHNLGFISGELNYWNDFLKQWTDMKLDWDDNHEEYQKREVEHPDDYDYYSSVFRFDMTPCYAYHTFLAPEDYGLIVLDQVKKKILQMQGYTTLGKQTLAAISLEMDWNISRDIREGRSSLVGYMDSLREKSVDSSALEFYDLCNNGRVVGLEGYNRVLDQMETTDLRGASTEDIFANIVSDDRTLHLGRFDLDLSPYAVERFTEDSEGAIKMRERILDLGFVLSDEEEKVWQEWIDDELEQEKEDGV